MKKQIWLLGAIMLALGAVSEVRALTDEELLFRQIPTVVIASNKNESVTEAPANVFVITQKEMLTRGYRVLNDLLGDIPGVYDAKEYGQSERSIRVRGQIFLGIKIMIDGMDLGPIDGSSQNMLDRFSVANIERVEFINGPYASLYGRNSFSGVFNIITKKGADLNGGIASVGYTPDYTQYQGDLVYGRKADKFDITGSVYNNATTGKGRNLSHEYPDTFGKDVINAANPGKNLGDYYLTTNFTDYYLKLIHDCGLEVNASHNKVVAPEGTQNPLLYRVDDGTLYKRNTTTLRAKYKRDINDVLSSETSILYNAYDYTMLFGYVTGPTIGRYYAGKGAGISYAERITYITGENNEIMAGVTYDAVDIYQPQVTAKVANPSIPDVPKTGTYGYLNGTLQDTFTLAKQLKLVAGVMYEHSAFSADVFMPRFSAMWNPTNKTTVKLLYGEGFLTVDRNYSTSQSIPPYDGTLGNKNLAPQRIVSYDLNVSHRVTDATHVTGSVFYNNVLDLITVVADSNLPYGYGKKYVNAGSNKAYGFELGLETLFWEKNKLFMNYSYVDGSQTSVDAASVETTVHNLKGTAQNVFNMGVNFIVMSDKLNIYLHERYVSGMKVFQGAALPGYGVLDLNLLTTDAFNKRWNFSAGIGNVFDKQAYNPIYQLTTTKVNVPIPRRYYTLKASYSF